MRKLRIGIIGTGMAFERLHYPAYQELQDKFQIAAICDIDWQKVQQWRSKLGLNYEDTYTDFRQMLRRNDLDAFDIMVPIELNFEVTEEVARAGKPIICEKPLAPNREQAKAARDLPRRYNIPIMIAENYRFNEEMNILRDLVRTREIGEVFHFVQVKSVDFPREMWQNKFAAREWRQHPEFPGGIFLDSAVHDVAGLRHIFGAIDKVQAFGRQQQEDFAPYAVIQTNMQFKSGITGQYTFFCHGQEPQRPLVGLRIFGTKGMIYLEERTCGIVNVFYNEGGSKQIPYQPKRGYYNELLNFYKASIGEEALGVTPEMEYGDAMTIFAILEALKDQKIVSVDKTTEFSYEKRPEMAYV